MTREDEIRERAEKTTAGLWEYDGAGCVGVYGKNDVHMYDICECDDIWTENAEANGEFIAHSREDIPYLLGEIDKLRSELSDPLTVRLPCKVGDMVYAIVRCGDIVRDYDDDYNTGTGAVTCPFESDCHFDECDDDDYIRIIATECTSFFIDENGIFPILDHVIPEISPDSFGKTVFLSREEAEKEVGK